MSTKTCVCGAQVPTVLDQCPVCDRAMAGPSQRPKLTLQEAREWLQGRMSYLARKSFGDKSDFLDSVAWTNVLFGDFSLENVIVLQTAGRQLKEAMAGEEFEQRLLNQFQKFLQMQVNIKSGERSRSGS